MIIVFSLGLRPVSLIKLSAVLDGLLLTPLQALWVGIGLNVVMPNMLRPHWIFAAGLAVSFLVFAYFCIFQIPYLFL